MTQLSNVGGGSVKIGGGGIKEGFNTFAKNHMAKGALGSKNLLSYTNMKDSTQKAGVVPCKCSRKIPKNLLN